MILIGPPMSGKDFWIKENFDLNQVVMISRDEIVLDVYGSNDYDEAFKNVDQKEVDKILISKIESASEFRKNVIINMTNMTRKRRIQNLSYFDNTYYKIAVIFPILDESEYERRNLKRKSEENKYIPPQVMKNMISSYQTVDKKIEGFDKIISI